MLCDINSPGPGFEYFLSTPCQDWDAVQYHESWKESSLGLDKAILSRSFNKQMQKIKEHGTEEEKKNAIRLENQFRFGGTGNIIQGYKRDYKNHEQPIIKEETSAIPTKKTKLDEKFNATKSSSELLPSINVKQTSTISEPDDVGIEEFKDDEEIKIDLTSISMELQREPRVKWKVGCINVTDRFRQYQKEVIQKAEKDGLKYENIYEVLALSSIMVLCWPCPYPMFTNREWKEITNTNPYVIKEPPLPSEISSSLYNATRLSVFRKLLHRNYLKKNIVICSFIQSVDRYLLVNDVSILNSEIKPLGYTPLQRMNDSLKVQLTARKSINQQLETKGGPGEAGIFLNMGDLMESFFMDLQYDGIYRSWPFLTTRLVIDKTTLPLAESAIGHLVALEERIEKIAENFKYRSSQFTPPAQMSFVRKLPDSPQIKMLLH
ncbi:14661_t:CDS:2 [Acaulospora colombiana]|uniref:14661_t:CDS:1 n=1 Tax=Acaulospora colombiana TaxID=27376 RepID=A0ACA9MDF1_9GLOM|nr:14661_t:CDS:2 [Acaulospora colombiana]